MKLYTGFREHNTAKVLVNGIPLNERTDLCNSPVGIEWGYNGSGPKQLSIALLSDYFANDKKAVQNWPILCQLLVSRLAYDKWTISGDQIKVTMLLSPPVPNL
jgi:hypothetical protein